MRFRRRNHIESNVDLDSRIPSRQGNACVGTYDNARASFRTLSAWRIYFETVDEKETVTERGLTENKPSALKICVAESKPAKKSQ